MQAAVSLPHSSLRTARAAPSREGCGTSRRRPSRNVELKTAKRSSARARPKRDTKRDWRAERQHAHAGEGPGSRTQDGLEFNPPVFLDVRKACAGKKVLIMGLPGAFTPC